MAVRFHQLRSCEELVELLLHEHFSAGVPECRKIGKTHYVIFTPLLDTQSIICIPCGTTKQPRVKSVNPTLMPTRDAKLLIEMRLAPVKEEKSKSADKGLARKKAKQLIRYTVMELSETVNRLGI